MLESLPNSEYNLVLGFTSFGYGLLPKGFGDANHAVLVAALGDCTQLTQLNLRTCYNLKSLPDSE